MICLDSKCNLLDEEVGVVIVMLLMVLCVSYGTVSSFSFRSSDGVGRVLVGVRNITYMGLKRFIEVAKSSKSQNSVDLPC